MMQAIGWLTWYGANSTKWHVPMTCARTAAAVGVAAAAAVAVLLLGNCNGANWFFRPI